MLAEYVNILLSLKLSYMEIIMNLNIYKFYILVAHLIS